MKRPILIALAALVLLGAKPAWAGPTDPYITLDTPGPYVGGQIITVTAHGDIPGHPGEQEPKAYIRLWCIGATTQWFEFIESPGADVPYTLHLEPYPFDGVSNGAADCTIILDKHSHVDHQPYTTIAIHVEA